MPKYQYKCGDGHVTEFMRSVEDRKEPVRCATCGKQANHGMFADIAEPDDGVVLESGVRLKNGAKWSGRAWRDFRCETCRRIEMYEVDFSAGQTLHSMACEKCATIMVPIFDFRVDPALSRYPYYDLGAGKTFNSAAERRAWMAAAGVEEIGDGAEDAIAKTFDRQRQEHAADEAAVRADLDRLAHSSNSDVRRALHEVVAPGLEPLLNPQPVGSY